MTRAMVLAGVMGLAGAALGQDLGHKAPPQTQPIAITGATVHTVSGATIEGGVVLFENGTISAVGDAAAVKLGEGVRVIDGAGKHVYPGLIAAVSQLGITEIAAVRPSRDFDEAGSVTPEARAAVAVNPDSWLFPVTRSNGVLLAGVFPTGGSVSGTAAVIRLDGWTWESMSVEADAGLVVNWPFMRTITAWWMDTPEEEQLKAIRKNLHDLDAVFASARAYGAAKRADPGTPTDLRWEAMGDVFPVGGAGPAKPVFISANGVDQITAAVSWSRTYGLRVVIVGGSEADLCADLLKQHDIPVIVMGTHNFPRRDDAAYDEAFTLPARLDAAGVRWCLASGEETPHERNLPYNAARASAFGLDRAKALRSITLSSAEILGIADRYGSVDAGKSATLILTDGDPLEVTTRVHAAFIDGREIDLTNKQSELAAKYREKYRQMKAAER